MAVILLVVADKTALTGGDGFVRNRLLARGHTVVLQSDEEAEITTGYDGVMVLDSCSSGTIGAKYAGVAKPGLTSEFPSWGMGSLVGGQTATSWAVTAGTPISAGLSGTRTVHASTVGQDGAASANVGGGTVVARHGSVSQVCPVVLWDTGTAMASGQPVAPARRVLFRVGDAAMPNLTADGLALFDAACDWTFGVPAAAPTVNAGADATVEAGTVFARTATEGGGAPTARAWTVVSGPAGAGSTIGSAAALSWTPTVPGVYVLRYTATNGGGAGFDDVQVTVVDSTPGGPTRFYLPRTLTPPYAPPVDPGDFTGTWDGGDIATRLLSLVKEGAAATFTAAVPVGTDFDYQHVRFVSAPLTQGGRLGGTVEWAMGWKTTLAAVGARAHVHIAVLAGQTPTVRGVLVDNHIDADTFSTSYVGRSGGVLAVTPVQVQAGDVIVVETGWRTSAATSGAEMNNVFGGTGATDLTDGYVGTDRPAWIQFSNLDGLAIVDSPPVDITVPVGRAVETTTARTTSRARARTTGRAVESTAARPAARAKLRRLTRATATHLAQPVARRRTRLTGRALDTATARTVGRTKQRLTGRAVETTLSTLVLRVKQRVLQRAAEADLASATGRSRVRQVTRAVEENLGSIVAAAVGTTLVQAIDTATAFAVRAARTVRVGRAADTSAGLPQRSGKTRTTLEAIEAAVAGDVLSARARVIGPGVEDTTADTARPTKARLVARATETAAVIRAVARAKTRRTSRAVETTLGSPARPAKAVLLPGAGDTTSATLIARAKDRPVTPAADGSTAAPLRPGKAARLAAATENGIATAIARAKAFSLGRPVGVDTALAVTRSKTRPILRVDDLATVTAARPGKTPLLAAAAELATVQAVVRLKQRLLGVAGGTSTAGPIGRAKARAVALSVEVAAGRIVTRIKVRTLAAAAENADAGPARPGRSRTLTAAVENAAAAAFTRSKTRPVGLAVALDVAQRLGSATARRIGRAVEAAVSSAVDGNRSRILGRSVEHNDAHRTFTPGTTFPPGDLAVDDAESELVATHITAQLEASHVR